MAVADGPRVAVVGGSLGGLLTALELRDVGCDVHVFERSPSPLVGRGAGIVLNPATTSYIERHRLLDLDRVSSSTRVLRYLTADGGVLLEEPIFYRFTSYGTLYAALVTAFPQERYHLGAECVGLEGDADGVEVLFEDSPAERFHLVVGADGVHSTVRGVLFPEVKPAYAGYVAWRGTLDEAALPEASAAGIGGALTYFVTHGSHILSYAIPSVESGGRDRLMNWVWYRNVSEGLELEALLTDRHGARHDMSLGPGDVRDAFIDELRAEARRVLPAAFAELVGASQWPFVQVVVDIVVPAMAVGRTCLIGDAAFALRPHIAAGTAKAAADAAALAEEIRGAGGDVSAALGVWAPRQLELGRAASARTREVGERVQFEGTYRPGDATVAFGLFRPKDSNFPETQGPGE